MDVKYYALFLYAVLRKQRDLLGNLIVTSVRKFSILGNWWTDNKIRIIEINRKNYWDERNLFVLPLLRNHSVKLISFYVVQFTLATLPHHQLQVPKQHFRTIYPLFLVFETIRTIAVNVCWGNKRPSCQCTATQMEHPHLKRQKGN